MQMLMEGITAKPTPPQDNEGIEDYKKPEEIISVACPQCSTTAMRK